MNPSITRETYRTPEAEASYMGSTQWRNWLDCPARTRAQLAGENREEFLRYAEDKECFKVGHYVETFLLEGDPAGLAYAETIGDDVYKTDRKGNRTGEKYAAFAAADLMVAAARRNETWQLILRSGKPQVPYTGKVGGKPWKVLVDWDATQAGIFLDLKTAADLDDAWSEAHRCRVPWYHPYWTQMAVYRAVVRQSLADGLGADSDVTPYLAALSKPTPSMPPRLEFVTFDDPAALDEVIGGIEARQDEVWAWKEGTAEPPACGRCWWCALHREPKTIRARLFRVRQAE